MLTTGTICGHLAEAVQVGEDVELGRLLPLEAQQEIAAAFQKLGFVSLTTAFQALGGRYDYGLLRLMRVALNRQGAGKGAEAV